MSDEGSADIGGGAETTATSGGGPAVGREVGEAASQSALGGSAKPAASKDKAEPAEKPPAPVFKYKRGGAEAEADGEALARMVSDDYEHEFTGPGGRPHKMKYTDLVQHAQLGLGADAKMRALAEERKRFDEEVRAAAGDDNARMAFMMQRLGIEDPDMWAIERAQTIAQARQQAAELMQQGRGGEAVAILERLQAERMQRRDMLDRAMKQRAESERESGERMQRHQANVRAAFEKAGIPWTRDNFEAAEAAHERWARLDIAKSYGEIASEVGKGLSDRRAAELREAIKRDGLGYFPEDVRRMIREMELEAAKAAKREGKAPEPKAQARPAEEAPKGQTMAEYMRSQRRSA